MEHNTGITDEQIASVLDPLVDKVSELKRRLEVLAEAEDPKGLNKGFNALTHKLETVKVELQGTDNEHTPLYRMVESDRPMLEAAVREVESCLTSSSDDVTQLTLAKRSLILLRNKLETYGQMIDSVSNNNEEGANASPGMFKNNYQSFVDRGGNVEFREPSEALTCKLKLCNLL